MAFTFVTLILLFYIQNVSCNINSSISLLKMKMAAFSAYCNTGSSSLCGPCVCIDDFDSPNKYYCDCTHLKPKRDCKAFYQEGMRIDGIYRVTMNYGKNILAYCDQNTNGGGWTVIQRRYDGSANFYRNWNAYKNGFGKLHKEFWFGNENIHLLSAQSIYPKGSEAMVTIRAFGYSYSWNNYYNHFQVDNEKSKYMLHISGQWGYRDSYDFVNYNNNMAFSTYDRDNDKTSSYHCARRYFGGWWYKTCNHDQVNLNGEYDRYQRQSWYYSFNYDTYKLEFSEIKIRRL